MPFLRRLDPRTKLLLVLLFTVIIFIVDSLVVAAVQLAFFSALCFAAGISPKKLFPHIKYMVFLIVFVLVLHFFFGSGLAGGLMIGCRILALTVLLPLLTMTTEARILACGIHRMGLPYRAAHIITSAYTLIPSFEEEIQLIMEARSLRGRKSAKIKEYAAVTLPLMIRAMRKAMLIGLAMDARAFGAYKTRSATVALKFCAIDYAAFAVGLCYAGLIAAVSIFLK